MRLWAWIAVGLASLLALSHEDAWERPGVSSWAVWHGRGVFSHLCEVYMFVN